MFPGACRQRSSYAVAYAVAYAIARPTISTELSPGMGAKYFNSYCYGMMDGEVLQDVRDGKLHFQNIKLR